MEKKYFKYSHRIYIAKYTINRPNHCVIWAIPVEPCNDPEYYFLGIVFRDGTIEEATELKNYPWSVNVGSRKLFQLVVTDMLNKTPLDNLLDANRLLVYVKKSMDEATRQYMSKIGKSGQQKMKEKYTPEQITDIRRKAALKGVANRKKKFSTPIRLLTKANEHILDLRSADNSENQSL